MIGLASRRRNLASVVLEAEPEFGVAVSGPTFDRVDQFTVANFLNTRAPGRYGLPSNEGLCS